MENVPWDWNDVEKEVPVRGRSVQTVLYAYADWKEGRTNGKGVWVDIKDAARRARQIQSLLDGFDG